MERKKIVHRLDTPYSTVEWPQIGQEDQDAILELLCRLLAPLGMHRKSYITPSKGRRRRPRKPAASDDPEATSPVPPAPELAAYVDVGLSNISRQLQDMSAAPDHSATPKSKNKVGQAPYSVVFVARSGQSSAFNCHFPQMAALVSKSQPTEEALRLVGFSRSCEDRLSAALGIPRVSSIAIRDDAPQAKGLVGFVRDHVAPIKVGWLQEARSGGILETKIEAVQTMVGSKRPKTS
ncbi:hypothetical protein B0H63DRAFT_481921 [Podospora didyma]|uniref:Uncharacterized protein n=1 Tax=Podospora didyma TaxID=330526 RepID=A0AAE0N8X8_9PEZI|nr:hypothetical protein B0H63DRAFT_481921 [Podospora didyma]